MRVMTFSQDSHTSPLLPGAPGQIGYMRFAAFEAADFSVVIPHCKRIEVTETVVNEAFDLSFVTLFMEPANLNPNRVRVNAVGNHD